MSDDSAPDTSPGGGRPVTLVDLMDEVLKTKAHVQALDVKVDTAIRPVRFPLAPLWVMAASVLVLALAGCYAVASGGVPVVVFSTHAASR